MQHHTEGAQHMAIPGFQTGHLRFHCSALMDAACAAECASDAACCARWAPASAAATKAAASSLAASTDALHSSLTCAWALPSSEGKPAVQVHAQHIRNLPRHSADMLCRSRWLKIGPA